MWRIIRQFPKYFIVLALIIGSSVLFGLWWFTRSPQKRAEQAVRMVEAEKKDAEQAAKAEARIDYLLMVDNDLYDIGNGELLFKHWLKRGVPLSIGYDADKKTLIARYERSFVRYAWDGSEIASLNMNAPLVVADDKSFLLFVKDKDIWRGDIDWKALKLVNERQVTRIGSFMEANFAGNILIGTDQTLIVRNLNQALRVTLETGEVHRTHVPPINFAKWQSPDHKTLLGSERGQFFAYDLDSDTTKTKPLGRNGFVDCQWLDNDRCAVLIGKSVVIYDRRTDELTPCVELPEQMKNIALKSPTGRYIFGMGYGRGVLIDLERQVANPLTGGRGVTWVGDSTFAFAREVQDSTILGTWRQNAISGKEERIYPKPYFSIVEYRSIVSMGKPSLIVFSTPEAVIRVHADDLIAAELAQVSARPPNLIKIERHAKLTN